MSHLREISISQPYFSQIRAGLKTVEGRKASPTWQNLEVGQRLKIVSPGEIPFEVMIIRITHYPDLESYLEQEGLARTLPGVQTLAEGQAIYHRWWSEAEIQLWGVLALELWLV